jgi:hypothetical protein
MVNELGLTRSRPVRLEDAEKAQDVRDAYHGGKRCDLARQVVQESEMP